ncbi:MAG: KH domain-containing protein [Clostridia bacterium]|nr:KH domain-containing protein [Clostridia bacterium]
MKEILQTIITNLVEEKDSVEIKELENENTINFEVKVAKKDMGKVIGKEGKVAKAIRTLMKSVAGKERKKVSIEFVEEN